MHLSLYLAASTMKAANTKVDTISNNMTNLNTVGFKSSHVSFQDLLYDRINQNEVVNREDRASSLGYYYGHGVRVNGIMHNLDQGQLLRTDMSHDVALEGPGMFQLLVSREEALRMGTSPEALNYYDGQFVDNIDFFDAENFGEYGYVFTREGNFRIDVREGYSTLVDPRGYQVADINGNPIEFDTWIKDFRVDPQGRVFLIDEDGTELPGVHARLMLAQFRNTQMLYHAGNNIYVENNFLQDNYYYHDEDALQDPIIANRTKVFQGYVENSNVDFTREMSDLISAQRMLQFGARAIQSADTMMGLANTMRS